MKFTLRLPGGRVAGRAVEMPAEIAFPQVGPSRPLDGLRVLVVDDEPDVRDVLETSLSYHGADVVVAADADAALAEIKARAIDLVIGNLGMPRVDGFELIRRIRALPGPAGRTPAIALTAYGREDQRARALASGYQQHVCKPVAPIEFVAVVAAIARGMTTESMAAGWLEREADGVS